MKNTQVWIAVAVLLLLLLSGFHWLYAHLIGNESPVWFNAMFFAQSKLAPVTGIVPPTVISILFLLWSAITMLLLWVFRSRLAALVWLVIAVWEAYFRLQQVFFILGEGFVIGIPMRLGLLGTYLSLIGALTAVIATFWYHRVRPRYQP